MTEHIAPHATALIRAMADIRERTATIAREASTDHGGEHARQLSQQIGANARKTLEEIRNAKQ